MKTCLFTAARNVRSAFRAHALDQHLIDHAEGAGMSQPLVTRLLVRSLNRTDGHPLIIERAERIARNCVYFEQYDDACRICEAAAKSSKRSSGSRRMLQHVGDAFVDMGDPSGFRAWRAMVRSLPSLNQLGAIAKSSDITKPQL